MPRSISVVFRSPRRSSGLCFAAWWSFCCASTAKRCSSPVLSLNTSLTRLTRPRSWSSTRLERGSITGRARRGFGSVMVTAWSPVVCTASFESELKSTVASTDPFARKTVRSPATNEGMSPTSSSTSTVCWNLARAAVYCERSLSCFTSAGPERSTVDVAKGFAMSSTPVSTPATSSMPSTRTADSMVVSAVPTEKRRRPLSATTRTVTSLLAARSRGCVVMVLPGLEVQEGNLARDGPVPRPITSSGGARVPDVTSVASNVTFGTQPTQREEPEDGRERERHTSEHEDGGERRRSRDAEAGQACGERGLLHPDPTRHRRNVAEHSRSDLHDHELGVVQPLVEREQAQAEQRRVEQVAREVAAEELQRLPRIAEHRPDVVRRPLDRGEDLAANPGDGEDDADDHGDRNDHPHGGGVGRAPARVGGCGRDGGGDQEQGQLDGTADTGAQHHRAATGGQRHALLVQVVELERGATDAVGRDQVQEAARELGEGGGNEGDVLVDAAHQGGCPRHRHEWPEDGGEQDPSPRRVLELALDGLPVDPFQAADRDHHGDHHAHGDPGVRPRQPADLDRLDVLGARRGGGLGAELLEELAEVLRVLPRAGRESRRLHERDHLADALFAEGADRSADRAVVAHAERRGHQHRRDVAVHPGRFARRVGGAEVGERSLTVGDDDAIGSEVPVADPGAVKALDLEPHCREGAVADLAAIEFGERGAGDGSRHEDRGIGTPNSGLDEVRGVHTCAI